MQLLLVLVTMFAAEATEAPWEQANDKNGIRVWVRDVPGESVREVKGEKTVAASVARIIEVLADVEHYTEFMPYVEEARVLERFDGGHYEYQVLNPPFVSRRDLVVKLTYTTDAATGIYRRIWVETTTQAPPVRSGIVRLQVNRGGWTLEPLGNGQTRVTYFVHTDPGGSLPTWIANKANTSSIPDLLKAVESRAQNPSWKIN
jgi:ribosome-associated toxin RatA of RatAB toxin-antitoxin module